MKKSLVAIAILLVSLSIPISAQEKIRDLKPTVVLVSLDGFRSDYLETYKPPNILKLAKKGVRAKWMIPSFPTKTYPNHYTIATGLYPAHHGIVANSIYDPGFDAIFGLADRKEVRNPRWWLGEPIWVTAQKQGQIAADYFFPGAEVMIGGVLPKYWKPYDAKLPNEERVNSVLSWFDLPVDERPTIFTLYFSDVDDAGHGFSPNSEFTKNAVARVDSMIGRLVNGLRERGIDGKVNLIVVSDHGMAAVPASNTILLEDMFDPEMAKQIFWVGEFIQIWPKEGYEDTIYESIKAKLPPQAKIYKKSEIPERFHYSGSRRIAPIIVSPDPGWVLINRERSERMKQAGNDDSIHGSHGYDNASVDMRALFVAKGKAFKKGYLAEPFSNVEVYDVMCRILGLKPAPNDGNIENVKGMLRK